MRDHFLSFRARFIITSAIRRSTCRRAVSMFSSIQLFALDVNYLFISRYVFRPWSDNLCICNRQPRYRYLLYKNL